MKHEMQIVTWNANGLLKHKHEFEYFLNKQDIDVALVTETYLSPSIELKIPNYSIYRSDYPSGNSRGGAAVIIKSYLQHYELLEWCIEEYQVKTVNVTFENLEISFGAVYSPPPTKPDIEQYLQLFASAGNRFILGGDLNAKNISWGSRKTCVKGRRLKEAIERVGACCKTSGEPTYWPTDPDKIPDLIDLFITKGISHAKSSVENIYDLSSDHTPVLLKISSYPMRKPVREFLHNQKTNWDLYCEIIDSEIQMPTGTIKKAEIDNAVTYFTNIIRSAAIRATPEAARTRPLLFFPREI